jgi:hypothetical protein
MAQDIALQADGPSESKRELIERLANKLVEHSEPESAK